MSDEHTIRQFREMSPTLDVSDERILEVSREVRRAFTEAILTNYEEFMKGIILICNEMHGMNLTLGEALEVPKEEFLAYLA